MKTETKGLKKKISGIRGKWEKKIEDIHALRQSVASRRRQEIGACMRSFLILAVRLRYEFDKR